MTDHVTRLSTADPDFETGFAALLSAKREVSEDVDAAVRAILKDVADNGDAAVAALTRRFDRVDVEAVGMRFSEAEMERAESAVAAEERAALELARDRIAAYHLRQKPADASYVDETGVHLGWRWTPVESAGIYVPGGTAAYPSSVLMNAIPARVAGVPRVAMAVPTPDGLVSPLVLVAARIAGVDEIYRIGGAQAIGALAYGTETIRPVVKITGPGNAYVAAAKRLVYGTVGIDMIAGPSEVVVVADGSNAPAWIAADLLAQAEHDTAAQSILVTDDPAFAEDVVRAVESHLETLPRAAIAAESWRTFGAIILVRSLAEEAPGLVDRLAPEHLELAVEDPDGLAERISNAGAIFLGRHTPEAVGDYLAGPNHVLPTARAARHASGLSVLDFMKRTSLLKCDADSLGTLAAATEALARAEGLEAHARSVAIRTNR